MTGEVAQQLLGSVFVLWLAGTLGVIGALDKYNSRRSEALFGAAVYLVVVTLVRTAAMAGALSQVDARILNGVLALPFVVVLLAPIVAEKITARRRRPLW